MTVESAPIARQALVEDRVIEMDAETVAREVPERFRDLLDDATLVCVPLSAGGRWSGVILADRRPRRPLSDERARPAVDARQDLRAGRGRAPRDVPGRAARQLQERIDLAREVHEGVIQRLFGVLLVVSSDAALPPEARERIDRRAAGRRCATCAARCSARSAGWRARRRRRCKEEVARLRDVASRPRHRARAGRATTVAVPPELEPLAQSVLAEAVRNAHKHASPDARRGERCSDRRARG